MKKIPKSLKTWFIIHFIVDLIFAIPLLFFPEWILGIFGLPIIQTVMARLVGAALIGIGGVSFWIRNEGVEVYKALLKLKLLWSSSAILGIGLSLFAGESQLLWIVLIIFAAFFGLWGWYLNKIK